MPKLANEKKRVEKEWKENLNTWKYTLLLVGDTQYCKDANFSPKLMYNVNLELHEFGDKSTKWY